MRLQKKCLAGAVAVGVGALMLGPSTAAGSFGDVVFGFPVNGPPIPDLKPGVEAVAILVTEGGTLTGPISQTTIVLANGLVTRETTTQNVFTFFGSLSGPTTVFEFGLATPAEIADLRFDLFVVGADMLDDQIAPILSDAPPSTLAFFPSKGVSNEFSFYLGLPGAQAEAGAIVTSFTDAVVY